MRDSVQQELGCTDKEWDRLEKLCELEGYEEPIDLLEDALLNGSCPSICTECDYSTNLEPDAEMPCPECDGTVKSACRLARAI